jgi:hypothetical protein
VAPGGTGSPAKGAARQLVDVAGGWGVEVPGDGGQQAPHEQQQQQQQQQQHQQQRRQAAAAQPGTGGKRSRQAKRQSTPFVSLQSPEGKLGLAMLQQSLVASEAATDEEGRQPQAGPAAPASRVGDVKAALTAAAAAAAASRRGARLSGAQARPSAPQRVAPAEDEEDEFSTAGEVPAFQLTFGQEGTVRG